MPHQFLKGPALGIAPPELRDLAHIKPILISLYVYVEFFLHFGSSSVRINQSA
jgi:hypothetical protein